VDPLRIGVEVNAGDLTKLAEASQQVATSVNSLSEQFVKGGMSAREIGQAVSTAASSFMAANPAVQAQTAGLIELKTALASAQAELKATGDIIIEAGGKSAVGASLLKQYGIESKVVADLQAVLKTATQQAGAALTGAGAAAANAVAGTNAQAAASLQAAEATAANTNAVKISEASLSQAGKSAMEMGAAMIEGSTAVQIAGQRFVALTRDLAIFREALVQTKAAMLEAGISQEQLAALTAQYGEQLSATQLLQRQATEAENEYKAALSESYIAVQASAAQQAAASAEKQAAALAAADAAAAEAAASEGMVAADVELATQENVAAEAALQKQQAQLQAAAASQVAAAATQQNTAALAANLPASQAALSSVARMAQTFMQSGLSAKEAQAALVSQGLAAKEAAVAMAELGIATAATGTETQATTAKLDSMTRALAYSGVRLASNELGVGQLGFALARVGSISATLAPLMAAAFPVFAIFAFVQITESAAKTVAEWTGEVQKAADESAKWERELLKSAEAVDKMNEKLAGTVGPLAEDAERMADLGHKAIDVTSVIEGLNKQIENRPGDWAKAWAKLGDMFMGTESHLKIFNRTVMDSVKTETDLESAISKVKERIKELTDEQERAQASAEAAKDVEGLAPRIAMQQKIVSATYQKQADDLRALIVAEQQGLSVLNNLHEASGLERLTIQQGMSEKLFAMQTRSMLATISLAEAEAKAMKKIHASATEDEITSLVRLNTERTNAELAEITKKEGLLAAQKARTPGTDFSAQEQAFQNQKNAIVTEGKRRELEIVLTGNVQIRESNLAVARTEIETDERVAVAHLRRVEAQQQIIFSRADTPEKVEKAAAAMAETATEKYELEAKAIRDAAAAVLDKLTAERASAELTTPKPTAAIGTDEYAKQLTVIRTIAPEIYAQLLKMNEEAMALREKDAQDAEARENEKWRKIRSIRAEELTNTVSALNNQLVEERSKYQDGVIALDTRLIQNKGLWSRYYADVKALAEKNYSEILAIENEEVMAVVDAVAAEIITEEEGQRKILGIRKKEEQAYKEMKKRELDAAKEAIKKEETDIDAMANKISHSFVRMGNTILTTHTSIGKAAMQLGRELELYIIEQGINTVAKKMATALLQMLASHVSFLANLLGIHVAGATAQKAVDTAANDAKIVSDAGVAGAAAFMSVMEALPFPENIAAAPGVMASAVATTLSNLTLGSAAMGAVVPQDMPIFAHAKEMVLPAHLSTFVQTAAAGAAGGPGGIGGVGGPGSPGGSSDVIHKTMHNHIRVEVHNNGGAMGQDDITAAVKRGIRRGALRW
jgi:hypothetical protein